MHYKACWISDLHLGCKKTEIDALYHFLKENEFDKLYLVGDIIDIWRMKKSGFLNNNIGQKHINVIQRILKLSKKGTKIYYIYGNHDEFMANFAKEIDHLGNIHFAEKIIHYTSSGKKYLVLHGHQFDLLTLYSPFIAKIGDSGYELLIWVNKKLNRLRRYLKLNHWSLSKYVKVKIKKAANFIANFSDSVARMAKEEDCDGVIAGHIHSAESKIIHGKHYVNCGCWTDSLNCNAVVEDHNGNLIIIDYGKYYLENIVNRPKTQIREPMYA